MRRPDAETAPDLGGRSANRARIWTGNVMESPLQRKLVAILYADVAGYSRLTGTDEGARIGA